MNLKEIREVAKDKLKGYCRVCKVCNGQLCAGEIPGMGGVGTGSSFHNNIKALADLRLNMRTLHDASNPEISTSIFNCEVKAPIIAAPITATSLNTGGAFSDVEWANNIVDACLETGIIAFTGDGPDPLHFQSGIDAINKHRGIGIPIIKPRQQSEVINYIRRAEEAGAIAVGMDVDGAGLIPMKLKGQPVGPKTKNELREIISSTTLPFVVKGIMTIEEAEIAAEAGAAAIVVSNHGGRALDHTPGTAEVLPEISARVRQKLTVLVDGGIRSGVDILKMLALGADAVLIGRPFFIAAAGGGKEGAKLVINSMLTELTQAMILTGCSGLRKVDSKVLR